MKAARRVDWALFWGDQNQMGFQEFSTVPLSTCPDGAVSFEFGLEGLELSPCHPAPFADLIRLSLGGRP